MRQCNLLFLGFAAVLLLSSSALAEGANDKAEPRFRLSDTVGQADAGASDVQRTPSAAQFSWRAITAGGPAAGAEPRIGDSRHASFYDFKDGNERPAYVAKSAGK